MIGIRLEGQNRKAGSTEHVYKTYRRVLAVHHADGSHLIQSPIWFPIEQTVERRFAASIQ